MKPENSIFPEKQIRLAVNYSPESERLLREKRINFDLFKIPDWPDLVSREYDCPPYVHFFLAAGLGQAASADWKAIQQIANRTRTLFINFHLIADETLDPLDPRAVEKWVQTAKADILAAAAQVGIEKVILENVPIAANGQDHLLPAVAPELIARIVRETGCGFLLDLAHARLVAKMLQISERGYLSLMPVERMVELHITGIGLHNGEWVDHLPMQPEDWDLLDYGISEIRAGRWSVPSIMAFEYGGLGEIFRWRSESDVLAQQVPLLYDRLALNSNLTYL